MNIVKQTTGNVVLTDTAGNILKVFVNVNALDIVNSNELIIKYGYNQWTSLFANQIDNTQVEPAAAISFNGNAYDLATLLSANFFFEVSGGGGGGTAASISYDNTISGLSATDVQDAIDELALEVIFTIELVDALTVDFYAPYDLKINTVSNILNSPTISIEDDGLPYTLTNTILSGSKITVIANTISVVNLNVTKV
jgi:hypothetical protein